MTERDIIIGLAKVDNALRHWPIIPGSQLYQCERCGEETWIAPASFEKLQEGAMVVCDHCVTKEKWSRAEITDKVQCEYKQWTQRKQN